MRFLKVFTILLPLVLFAACSSHALASDASFSLVPATNYLLEYVIAAGIAVLGWVVSSVSVKLKNWIGISIDDSQRAVVMGAIERGLNYAADVVRLKIEDNKSLSVNLRSMLIVDAAQYVQNRVPDALAHFKLSPDDISDLITAKLDESKVTEKFNDLLGA